MPCCGSKYATLVGPTGTVDENGVMWKSTRVGSFVDGYKGCKNLYSTLAMSARANLTAKTAGLRPVVKRSHTEDGFEKLVLGDYEWMTYGDYFNEVEAIGAGLAKALPISAGDTVVIYADTQRAWMQAAYGCWRQGLVVGTIYATLGEEGALYGINQSKCKAVVADGKLLKILAKICTKFTTLKDIVAIDTPDEKSTDALAKAGLTVHLLDDLKKKGLEAPVEPYAGGAETDTAVLMYTSGTTGNPKGVLISHKAVLAIIGATASDTGPVSYNGKKFIRRGAVYLAYLPLAHIMELAVELTLFAEGVQIGYGNPQTLTPTGLKLAATSPPQKGDLACLRPTMFVAAPAVLDKVFVGLQAKLAELAGWKYKAAQAGLVNGKAVFAAGGCGTSGFLSKLVLSVVAKKAGFDRCEAMLTGSAPLSVDVQIFMQTVFNCPVRQGYGLTETCAATCITLGEDNSTSCVGPPQESACLRLRDWEEGKYFASDKDDPKIGMRRGEVLIGGPGISDGYLVDKENPDPEIVAKNNDDYVTIDGIRYFCTGDIGQFTKEGNLMIIDRKKDLVKLQMGEYVALSKVENVLKACKYTQLPMVYALPTMDYCIALICPNIPKLTELGVSLGLDPATSLSELCTNAKVLEAVLAEATATCKTGKLAKFEIPTKIILVDDLWTPDNDMLTAVQKLKRKEIVGKHQKEIDAVYTPSGASVVAGTPVVQDQSKI